MGRVTFKPSFPVTFAVDRPLQEFASGSPPPPAWTPADLPGIVDFGVYSDLSRLKQNSDGSGTVASVDDPIGWWRGQLDVLTFIQGNAGNKPKYAADGVYFLGAGGTRFLDDTRSITRAAAMCLVIVQRLKTASTGQRRGTALQIDGPGRFGMNEDAEQNTQWRWNGTNRSTSDSAWSSTGKKSHIYQKESGTVDAVGTYVGVAPFTVTNTGAFLSGNNTAYRLIGDSAGDSSVAAWVICNATVSGADLDNLTAWINDQ
jgi:hypothetical protein